MRLLTGCLLWLMLASAGYAETRDPHQYFFGQNLGDFKGELAVAKQEGKKGILIMFEVDDCPFCHRMKQTILSQSEVQDYYRSNFLIFSVDAVGANPMVDFKGRQTTEKNYANENRIRATPVFVFFNLEGNQVMRFTGAAKDTNEFLQLGRYVAEGAYKSMPFAKFRQQVAK